MPHIQGPQGNLYYETFGQGKCLVLLHGLWSQLGIWKNIIPGLSADHKVVLLDQMGHGKSNRMRSPYRLEDYATDLKILLDTIGAEQVGIIGFSMGALVAQEFYFLQPDRVNALVFIACPPPYKRLWRIAISFVSLLERMGITSLKTETIKSLVRRYSKGTDPDIINKSLKDLEKYSNAEFNLILRSVWHQRKIDRLRTIKIPALIMVGEKDGIKKHSEKLNQLIPDSQLIIIPKSNHSVIFDQPKYLTEQILKFLP